MHIVHNPYSSGSVQTSDGSKKGCFRSQGRTQSALQRHEGAGAGLHSRRAIIGSDLRRTYNHRLERLRGLYVDASGVLCSHKARTLLA